jgi:putative phosphoesterase
MYGANMLHDRLKALESQFQGVLVNEDMEFVHRLRVASRRVRAALPIFRECIPSKSYRRWLEEIKKVTEFSGAARDLDVQISFLEAYSNSLEDEKAKIGIGYLLDLESGRRASIQLQILRGLDDLRRSGVLAEAFGYCEKIISGSRSDGTGKGAPANSFCNQQKAQHHVVSRLDDFLAMESFVHDEGAILKHHAMRIAAKKLRYTLEIFSLMYPGELKEQISLMKQFQDLLGEMHDLDVWIQTLNNIKMNSLAKPADVSYGLSRFLGYVTERRKSRYGEFVSLWEDVKSKGGFEGIRQAVAVRLPSKAIEGIENPKVALISDIHGNQNALAAVIKDASELGVIAFLNAGDSVGFGIYPNDVVETLRSTNVLSVAGNFDLKVLDGRQDEQNEKNLAVAFAVKELSSSNFSYLKSLPKELQLQLGNKSALLTHGSPASVEEHIYPDLPEERMNELATMAKCEIMIIGHIHRQFSKDVAGVTFINPGSVGRPDDGDPRAEYAVLSLNPLSVEFRRVAYDVESLAHAVRKKGLPEGFAQMFLRGISLDSVKEGERLMANKQLWKKRSTLISVQRAAKKYGDVKHGQQDRRIALKIFDQLKEACHLTDEERFWLECAAILHDIGISRGRKGHNKASLSLILNDQKLPFTLTERYIVGSIARYHRGALPKKSNYNLAHLDKERIPRVLLLSSILKVADALDYSHNSVVKDLTLKVLPKRIIMECIVSGDCALENMAVEKKKDLFEKVFKKDLAMVWKPKPAT